MANDQRAPVVEPKPIGGQRPDVTQHSLELRIRQQEILSNLGVSALKGVPFSELIDQAAKVTADGLEAEFCKVMEYLPAENAFVVRSGVGWDPKMIGTAKVGADLESPAGYALRTGQPVISNHLEYEERFRTPELLLTHGIHRAVNVILEGDRSAYGVLEVDSQSAGEFTTYDLTFLQGVANILGMAIERQRIERELRSALDRHKLLLSELNHRVKNSLQLVVTTLRLQEGAVKDAEARAALSEASSRVVAIARAHENLYRGGDVERIDLGQYLSDICGDMRRTASPCEIETNAIAGILVPLDKAIPIALIVNELVTNAIKHAYPKKSPDCFVRVSLDQVEQNLVASVRDAGIGVPHGFTVESNRGMGSRIILALAGQLGAKLTVHDAKPGAEFILRAKM